MIASCFPNIGTALKKSNNMGGGRVTSWIYIER